MMKIKRKTDYVGLRVRSTCSLANSLGKLPPNTVYTVIGWSRGLELQSDPCSCCNMQLRINKVPLTDCVVIDDEYNRSKLSWNKARVYTKGAYGMYWKNPDYPCPEFVK